MSLVFKLFWGAVALELLLWLMPSLTWRRLAAMPVMGLVCIAALAILFDHPSIPTIFLLIASAYRMCNLLRLARARMNEKYLHRMTRQASLWITGTQTVILLLWQAGAWLHLSTYHLWLALAYADLIAVGVLLVTTLRHLRTTRSPRLTRADMADRDLPTLTVAIPARNETDDLEACLASLVASDYPKLEILVLDDCSQNKHTPEIIRSFAHDGVVFLRGREPGENWLAKNQAYQQLFEEANGELILFCGVDVRFAPESLHLLVGAMLHKGKSMMSIIPHNTVPEVASTASSTLLQPMRYAWELSLPRKLFRRPPVLSTCWIAKRELIRSSGGFAAVSRSIVPESYFARVSAVHDGYSFMRGNGELGILSTKSLREQRDTAIRMRYPQLHRRIELVLLVTLAELTGIALPYALVIMALFGHLSAHLTILSAATVVLATATYVCIVALTYRTWLARSIFLFPAALVVDVVLLNYSMIRYEFFDVIWKGRNVCIPVMRFTEHPAE